MTPTRRGALIAGLLYFSTHITSVAAVVAYGSALTAPGAASVSDTALLTGVALDVLLALGVLGTGVVLLPILRQFGPARAYAFSAMRTLEAAVIAAGALPMLALVWLRGAWRGDGPAGAAAVADALVGLHQASFLVGQGLVISVNTIVLASLLLTSGLVPRWIAVLGLAGGSLVLVGNALQLFGAIDRAGVFAGISAVAAFAFELSFAGYLVLRGVRALAQAPTGSVTKRPSSRRVATDR